MPKKHEEIHYKSRFSLLKSSMKKIKLVIGYFLLVVLIGIISLFMAFSERDIPIEKIKVTYANKASSFMPLMGMKVHYRDEGNSADSLPLVLIHGTSSSLHTWDSLTSLLLSGSNGKKRIIRLDMPGFGLTGPSPENVYTFTYFSAFLDSFLHKLQVKSCIIAGNSLGGGIAWHFSLANPDKVSKIILIDASGYPIKNEKGALGFKIARMPIVGNVLLFITPKTLVEKSLENVFYNKSFVTASIITRYHDLLLSEGNRKAALSMFQNPMKQNQNDIRQINKPTLILWGEKDQLISVNNAFLFNQDIKGSRVEVYKNVGHIPMEEAPVLTAGSIIRFLGEL